MKEEYEEIESEVCPNDLMPANEDVEMIVDSAKPIQTIRSIMMIIMNRLLHLAMNHVPEELVIWLGNHKQYIPSPMVGQTWSSSRPRSFNIFFRIMAHPRSPRHDSTHSFYYPIMLLDSPGWIRR